MEEFVSVDQLKSKYPDASHITNVEPSGIDIYQVQGVFDTNSVIIAKAGILPKLSDVLIKEFDFLPVDETQAAIISCLYDESIFSLTQTTLVKILVRTNQIPVASLSYNFHSEVIKESEVRGYFSITLKKEGEEFIQLEKSDKYPGHQNVVKDLVVWLYSEQVIDILVKS